MKQEVKVIAPQEFIRMYADVCKERNALYVFSFALGIVLLSDIIWGWI